MKIARFVLALAILVLPIYAMAQPGDPGGGGNPTVPISGIEFLVGGGVILGLRRLLKIHKSRKE